MKFYNNNKEVKTIEELFNNESFYIKITNDEGTKILIALTDNNKDWYTTAFKGNGITTTDYITIENLKALIKDLIKKGGEIDSSIDFGIYTTFFNVAAKRSNININKMGNISSIYIGPLKIYFNIRDRYYINYIVQDDTESNINTENVIEKIKEIIQNNKETKDIIKAYLESFEMAYIGQIKYNGEL